MSNYWEPERPSPENLCLSIFDLEFPPKEDELKSRFRERTMKGSLRHPDKGGTDAGFRELKEAYDFLLPFCNINSKIVIDTRTIEGYLISDLGKGLGSTTNGTECKTCKGQGHYSVSSREYKRELGDICKYCHGLGYGFLGRSSIISICRNCKGTGGRAGNYITIDRIHRCSKCEGSGETRIFNPAFQKGAVSLSSKRTHNKQQKKVIVKNPLFQYKETV